MEVVNSFFSNIKDKLTNPYFGTLIIVLIIHHWELIFGIFNFDDGVTLDKKLEFVKNYIVNNITWKSFIWDALQALLYMLIGYLIVVLTRSIVLFIEFGLMPLITGKIVNKNVVRRTEYDEVVQEREQYFDQYEEQRNYVRNFSKTIDDQTEQLKQKDANLLQQTNTISETISKLDSTKNELEFTKNENSQKSLQIDGLKNSIESLEKENGNFLEKVKEYEHLYFSEKSKKFYSEMDKFPPEILNKVQELKNDDKWKAFLHLGQYFETGGSIGGELLTEMIKRGLAFERGKREDLTPIGKIIYRYNKVFEQDFDKRLLLIGK
jgi:hypothetical protein